MLLEKPSVDDLKKITEGIITQKREWAVECRNNGGLFNFRSAYEADMLEALLLRLDETVAEVTAIAEKLKASQRETKQEWKRSGAMKRFIANNGLEFVEK